jgi:hypothetical protein
MPHTHSIMLLPGGLQSPVADDKSVISSPRPAQREYCLPLYSFVGTCGGYPGAPLLAYRICWCWLLELLLL